MDQRLFSKAKQLLSFGYFIDIQEHESFSFLKSIFKSPSYNFIVPKKLSNELDLTRVQELLETQETLGYKFSFYIPDDLVNAYKDFLNSFGYSFKYTDVYVSKQLDQKFNLDKSLKYEFVTESNLNEYLSLVDLCFPDYNNNKEYCEFCLTLSRRNVNANLLLYKNGTLAGSASSMFSKDVGLAYMHNDCVHPNSRRQGLHHELIKKRINDSIDLGIFEFYANVEENSASYNSYLKLGFQVALKMNVFN